MIYDQDKKDGKTAIDQANNDVLSFPVIQILKEMKWSAGIQHFNSLWEGDNRSLDMRLIKKTQQLTISKNRCPFWTPYLMQTIVNAEKWNKIYYI